MECGCTAEHQSGAILVVAQHGPARLLPNQVRKHLLHLVDAAIGPAAHLVGAGQAGSHRRADLVLARVRFRALLFLLALLISKAAVLGVLVDVMAVHGSTLAGELSHTGVERDDAVALRAQRGGPGKNRCG